MSDEAEFTAIIVVTLAGPSLLGCLILQYVRWKSKSWPSQTGQYWRTFWWAYLIIQTAIAGMNFMNGMQSTGEEDVPVWGLTSFTTWGAALVISPLLASIVTALMGRKPK